MYLACFTCMARKYSYLKNGACYNGKKSAKNNRIKKIYLPISIKIGLRSSLKHYRTHNVPDSGFNSFDFRQISKKVTKLEYQLFIKR